jgi:hypothetical protein
MVEGYDGYSFDDGGVVAAVAVAMRPAATRRR